MSFSTRPRLLQVLTALAVLTVLVNIGGTLIWLFGHQDYTWWQCVFFTLYTVTTVGYAELPHLGEHLGALVAAPHPAGLPDAGTQQLQAQPGAAAHVEHAITRAQLQAGDRALPDRPGRPAGGVVAAGPGAVAGDQRRLCRVGIDDGLLYLWRPY